MAQLILLGILKFDLIMRVGDLLFKDVTFTLGKEALGY